MVLRTVLLGITRTAGCSRREVREQEFTGLVPAILIGIVGYLIARETGKNRLVAAVYGVTMLALGVLVATVKLALAAH